MRFPHREHMFDWVVTKPLTESRTFCKSPAKRGLTVGSWCGTIDTKAGTVPSANYITERRKQNEIYAFKEVS